MAFGGMILTNKGREALTRAQLGGQLNFTGVAVGDGSYGGSYSDIKALSNQIAVLDVLRADTKDNVCTVEADLSNAELAQGYYLREIGILAECGDETVLYAYANAGTDAEYIPAGDGAVSMEKRLRFSLITEGVENITFSPSSVLYLAQQDFEEAMQGIQEQLDGKAEKSEVEALAEAAFSGSYNDLRDKPDIPAAVRVKGEAEEEYRTGDVNITKESIGLGDVPGRMESLEERVSRLELKIYAVPVEFRLLSKPPINGQAGQTITFICSLSIDSSGLVSKEILEKAADDITWTSSNTTIASVTSHYIRTRDNITGSIYVNILGHKSGNVTVTGTTSNGMSVSCTAVFS